MPCKAKGKAKTVKGLPKAKTGKRLLLIKAKGKGKWHVRNVKQKR